ncbi:MAG: hypothetical protein V1863_06715 [Candidatus Omnitrophota bacterium]
MSAVSVDLKSHFLATAVGSLPQDDPRQAVDFVFDVFASHVPFWPQLPRRSFLEQMVVQYSEKLPGLVLDVSGKRISIDTQTDAYTQELEETFNKCQAQDTAYFGVSRSHAEGLYFFAQRLKALSWKGWAKAQVIGPLSLGLSLLDEKKNPILYNPELRELLPLFLARKASWVARHVKAAESTKSIVFIDEPYLVSIGTAQSGFSRQEFIESTNLMVEAIQGQGALAGLHCCGNTDWEMVLATGIDILSFDAYGYLDKFLLYPKALEIFLERGGLLALGIVPNSQELLKKDLEQDLVTVLRRQPRLIKNGALITPSCGCGSLSPDLSEKAHRLCVTLAQRLSQEF